MLFESNKSNSGEITVHGNSNAVVGGEQMPQLPAVGHYRIGSSNQPLMTTSTMEPSLGTLFALVNLPAVLTPPVA